jgi:hypothetical protein
MRVVCNGEERKSSVFVGPVGMGPVCRICCGFSANPWGKAWRALQRTFPASNPIAGDSGSSLVPTSKGWRSYLWQSGKTAKDGAAVAATLKGLGVENEALDSLTEAMSSHSVLVAVVAIGGLEFYRYNCP